MKKYDILVIGAGITGLASAYHLMMENRDINIGIIDKYNTFGQGNTGKSDAAFRDIFTSEINYKLSSSSIAFYKYVQNELKYDLGMHFNGYLFLLDEDEINSEKIEKVRKRSETEILWRDEILSLGIKVDPSKEAMEIMKLKRIAGGLLGKNCGILEPQNIASFYAKELEKMGAEFIYGTKVNKLKLEPTNKLDYPGEPFIWQDKRIGRIETSRGDMEAEKYILATDVWTNELLDPVGIDSHIRPRKRQVFQVSGENIRKMVTRDYKGKEGIFPFTVLPNPKIVMRPEPGSGTFWISYNDEIGRDFSLEEDPQPEMEFYLKNELMVLREYISAFNNSKVNSAWAGYYSENTIDGTYYIFQEMNLIVATGSSGSGIMKGDSAGRIVASLVEGKSIARLFNGIEIPVEYLGVKGRNVEKEELVI
ncbi:MAG: FAD-binding oxidoreductase [Thermoplasmata archaeon]